MSSKLCAGNSELVIKSRTAPVNKKTIAIIVLIIVIPILFYALFPSDLKRIKKLFSEGAKAVEAKELDSVMSKISYNYRDDYGMTYLYVKESMKRGFQQMSDIRIEYENLKITIQEKAAKAEMDVMVLATIGNDTGYILGNLSKPAHLTFTLEKERTKWLITRSEGILLY
jgi:hypothetical protein